MSAMRQSVRKSFEVREEHVAPFLKFSLFVFNSIAWVGRFGVLSCARFKYAWQNFIFVVVLILAHQLWFDGSWHIFPSNQWWLLGS